MTRGRYVIAGGVITFAVFFIFGVAIQQASSKEQPNNTTKQPPLSMSAEAIQQRNVGAITSLRQQTNTDTEYTIDGKTNTFTSIIAKNNSLPLKDNSITKNATAVARQFMNEYGKYFGLRNATTDLQLLKNEKDTLGTEHVRYTQTYNGIPVFGAQAIVHVKKDLGVASVNGNTIPNIAINTTPLISKKTAIQKAKNLWTQQEQPISPSVLGAELQIFNKSLINNSADTASSLVWKVELYKRFPQAHEYYFINAHSGQLTYQLTGIQTVVDRRIYDCALDSVFCYLDTSFGGHTYGRSEGQPANGANPLVGGTDVDDTYTFSGNLHNYYNARFGLNGGNNNGGLGDGSNNPVGKTDGFVYIDYVGGDCPNAYFDGFSINFCKGYEVLDVLGHEYTHGVGWFAVPPQGLTYSYESGALSEGYSDIFGDAAQNYVEGSSDWLMGEDLPAGTLRDLSDPASGGYPDRFYSANYYCGTSDGGGVHTNATVLGHAAYLAAVGGTFNGCTISGIGRSREEQIFYRAYTTYSVASTDFNDTYTYLNTSCADLYGATSTYCINLKKALQAVELDQPGRCSATARVTPACTAPTVTSVTSRSANGYYNTGKRISVTVNFSTRVTGSGTIHFNSGGHCTISASNAASASCWYTVLKGESSSDLSVSAITGSFTNQSGDAATSLAPATNLAASKSIIVDTTPPSGTISINSGATYAPSSSVTLSLYASDTNRVPYMRFSNDRTTWSAWESPRWTKSWTVSNTNGTKKVYVQYKDNAGNVSTFGDTIILLKPAHILAVAGPGGNPLVKAFTYAGAVRSTPRNLYAFNQSYRGGIHIAACDVDGNGTDEIISAVGAGEEPWVKVLRQNGTLITTFLAYGKNIKGGVFLACGDLNGDRKGEIITGVPEGFGPHVRTFSGMTGKPIISMGFFAYASNVRTGIRVASGDLNGDGKDEIIVGTGSGAGTHVRTFTAAGQPIFTPGFFAYGKTDRTGIKVAAGDVNGDGKDEIITATGKGRVGEVKVYDRYGTELKKFNPYGTTFTNGVKVSAGDVNGDGKDEIITSTDVNSAPFIRTYSFSRGLLGSFYSLDKNTRYGAETAVAALD